MPSFYASKRPALLVALFSAAALAEAMVTGACGAVSTQSGRDGGGGGGGDDCAALAACCAQLTGAIQPTCQSDVATNNESNCASRLGAFKGEGACDVDAGSGTMTTCGGLTQVCCADGACKSGLTCLENACAESLVPPSDDAGEDGATAAQDGSTDAQIPVGDGSCANPTVPIVFSPMYSAYIPGSTSQVFQVPASTRDGQFAVWSLSDPTQASLAPQALSVTRAGVVITTTGGGGDAGPDASSFAVTVVANKSDGTCGAATLAVTLNTQADWTIGQMRYQSNGIDGGATACTTCHGPTATAVVFKDVQRTPEQTAGFSDSDLAGIILNGTVPIGGYFDPSVLDALQGATCDDAGTTLEAANSTCFRNAYNAWQGFHKWTDVTPSELTGLICYLRSLAPESIDGGGDFWNP
jgi:cytochrome c553